MPPYAVFDVRLHMEIILVRHGETEYNKRKAFHGWIDSELNERGILQAEKIAAHLGGERIDIVISSPLKRAFDIAHMISKEHEGVRVDTAVEIKEVNFGLFEGLTYEDICEKYSEEAKSWEQQKLDYCFPEGENIKSFFERVKLFLENLILKEYKKVVLVTHEGCIRCILSYITTSSMEAFWKYSVKTGSVSRVAIDKDFSYILSLNENL